MAPGGGRRGPEALPGRGLRSRPGDLVKRGGRRARRSERQEQGSEQQGARPERGWQAGGRWTEGASR